MVDNTQLVEKLLSDLAQKHGSENPPGFIWSSNMDGIKDKVIFINISFKDTADPINILILIARIYHRFYEATLPHIVKEDLIEKFVTQNLGYNETSIREVLKRFMEYQLSTSNVSFADIHI